MIERQKTEEDEEDYQHKNATINNNLSLVIDAAILNDVEKCSFSRKYITESLKNDELNYATAFYYLLTIKKEY